MSKIRNLFAAPKKAAGIIIGIIAVFAILAAGIVMVVNAAAKNSPAREETAKSPVPANAGVNSASGQITMEDAKESALTDAGLTLSQVTFTEEKLDVDGGVLRYEFEFFAGNVKYEYEIDAATGAVYSKSKETAAVQSGAAGQQNGSRQNGDQEPSGPRQIGLEEAKSLALADAGVSAEEAAFTKTKQDLEDGITVYEVEFYTATHQYDYEINAATGEIRERSAELLQGGDNSGAYIGVDQAKSIAASHAGLSVDGVEFSKAGLDHDDGRAVYEIEFYQGGAEYEYTVDALTGDILEYESDHRD